MIEVLEFRSQCLLRTFYCTVPSLVTSFGAIPMHLSNLFRRQTLQVYGRAPPRFHHLDRPGFKEEEAGDAGCPGAGQIAP